MEREGRRRKEVEKWFSEQGKLKCSNCQFIDIKLTFVQVNRHFQRCCGRGQYAEVLWYEGSGRGR